MRVEDPQIITTNLSEEKEGQLHVGSNHGTGGYLQKLASLREPDSIVALLQLRILFQNLAHYRNLGIDIHEETVLHILKNE